MDLSYIVYFLINFVVVVNKVLYFAIFARIILSWISVGKPNNGGVFSQLINDVTEPVLRLVRLLPHRIGMIDLSPLIALILLDLVATLLIYLLSSII